MPVSDVQKLILGKTNGKLNHGWNWFCYGRYWQQLKPLKDLFKLDLLPGIHNSYVMYELLSEMSWRQVGIEG